MLPNKNILLSNTRPSSHIISQNDSSKKKAYTSRKSAGNKSSRKKDSRMIRSAGFIRDDKEIVESPGPETPKFKDINSEFGTSKIYSDVSLLSVISVRGMWSVGDVAKAALLLSHPPKRPLFYDDLEQRRVFTLIYDVFRYKHILIEALNHTGFWDKYPQFGKNEALVRLIYFDLYHRHFSKHDHNDDEIRNTVYTESGILEIDNAIWDWRIRLGAAISKIRIKNNARKLSQLLPPHLRDEKMSKISNSGEISGWVNCFRCKKKSELTTCLSQLGMLEAHDNGAGLEPNQYRFDHFCHKLMLCRPELRAAVSESWLVRRHYLVLQSRTFCIGPVMFCTLLNTHQLAGDVVQTHMATPQVTAYLANLLRENNLITGLLAFGAGKRKNEFDHYFMEMGITNTTIFSESFQDIPWDSDILKNAVAIFATPPNTYTAVTDPIDLVCSRGGDLDVLDILTMQQNAEEGQLKLANILKEQVETLRHSMSNSQIEIVLYETHSISACENGDMLCKMVGENNDTVRTQQLLELQVNKNSHADQNNIATKTAIWVSNNGMSYSENEKADSVPEDQLNKKEKATSYHQFELAHLPDICPQNYACLSLKDEGCYLGVIQKKNIYQPKVETLEPTESGLPFFEDEPTKPKVIKSSKAAPSVEKKIPPISKRVKVRIERIAAPTQASLLRQKIPNGDTSASTNPNDPRLGQMYTCPRHRHHLQEYNSKQGDDVRQSVPASASVSSRGPGRCEGCDARADGSPCRPPKLSPLEREEVIRRLMLPTRASINRIVYQDAIAPREILTPDQLTVISLARRLEYVQYFNNNVSPYNRSLKCCTNACPPSTPATKTDPWNGKTKRTT